MQAQVVRQLPFHLQPRDSSAPFYVIHTESQNCVWTNQIRGIVKFDPDLFEGTFSGNTGWTGLFLKEN